MLSLTREITLLGLALLTAVALVGCGGGDAQKGTSVSKGRAARALAGEEEHSINMFAVVKAKGPAQAVLMRVGSTPITVATFNHWEEVLTPKIASYEPKSRSDCSYVMAPREVKLSAEQKAAKPSPAQIKALCLSQHKALVKEKVLEQLISNQWVTGEAEELGLGVSDAEAQKQVAVNVSRLFKSRREYLQYIASSGRTVADTLLAVSLEIASQRIEQLIERKAQAKLSDAAISRYYREHKQGIDAEAKPPGKQSKQASSREVEEIARTKLSEGLVTKEATAFTRAFREKWRARTSCAPGYVISRCREFPRPEVLLSEDPSSVR
jgi:hypothetical protein